MSPKTEAREIMNWSHTSTCTVKQGVYELCD